MSREIIVITRDQAGATLAAILRKKLPGQSWSALRKLVAARRLRVGGDLCLDPARRLKEGETVELLDRPLPRLPDREDIVIRYLDEHVVVVEKPAGIPTVRHPAERNWPQRRRSLAPTLDDLVLRQLGRQEKSARKGTRPGLRVVQRLDKETSGLVVFARTVTAERALGRQFKAHSVLRRYLAVVPGYVSPQTIVSRLMRDRGDRRRGSLPPSSFSVPSPRGKKLSGKKAITHVEVVERLPGFTLLSCRLETGRTHQIRIHLAELGHPICGDKVYRGKLGSPPLDDSSGAPRLALHAADLGFVHPVSGANLEWSMALPMDLQEFLDWLRKKGGK